MTDFTHCPAGSIEKRLLTIYEALLRHFGHRHWWPAKTPFEVCVGAILTQNTAWSNVKKAIDNLAEANLLTLKKLSAVKTDELARLIRPSGYFNQKADRLHRFACWVNDEFKGSLDLLFDLETENLREKLLAFNGIGRETTDSIILYAANKPKFVVDAYTKRIFHRKALVAKDASYAAVQELFERYLPLDVALYNDYHAQIVALGHNFCRPKPLCEKCPINGL